MKRLLFTLEITMTMFFILLAFALGVMAGWQSAASSERHSQTMTLKRTGE